MAAVSIWNGSCAFDEASNPTPFGFYDSDLIFQSEAPKVASFCAKKLGYPMMDVELECGNFFAAFEEAVTAYGAEVFQSLASQNFGSLSGGSTANAVNTTLIRPSLNEMIRTSKMYGMEAGVGGNTTMYTGSLPLIAGQQDYDLQAFVNTLPNSGVADIRRVFYEAPPAITRYFDPFAGSGTSAQGLMDTFDFGKFSPGINFMLMPVSFDLLKTQGIEFNDAVRKSAFTFEIVNNKLKIFPIPKAAGKLRFEYYLEEEKRYVDDGLNVNAEASSTGGVGGSQGGSNIVTNMSNVPTENPIYADINSIGRQWIYKYAAAVSKETLAYVRGKYQTVPVPGSEATLNQADLLADARTEKSTLIEDLKQILQTASLSNQLEMQATQTKYINDALTGVPNLIYIG